jgi:Ribosome inactivating protein
MLDKVTYPLNVALATQALTNSSSGFTGTRPNPRTTKKGWAAFQIQQDSDYDLTLLFCLDNLYLEGFQNKNGVFLHKTSKYSITPTKKFSFGNEYGELGYGRTAAITITLDNLNGALGTFQYANTGTNEDQVKRAFLYCAIGFSEAIRFDDVIMAILKGDPISDLDWDKHKDASKVRVVKV